MKRLFILFVYVFCLLNWEHVAHAQVPHYIAAVPSTFPPIYTTTQDGHVEGFGIDILNAIAKRAGITIEYRVYPSWALAMDAIQRGEADVIPNLGITSERMEFLHFAHPLQTISISAFTRASSPPVQTKAQLEGGRIGVMSSNAGYDVALAIPNAILVTSSSPEKLLFMLLSGKVDSVIYPKKVFLDLASKHGVEEQINSVSLQLKEVLRTVAVSKENPLLAESLKTVVKNFVETTEFKNIYQKWYGSSVDYSWLSLNSGYVLLLAGFLMCGGVAVLYRAKVKSLLLSHKRQLDTMLQAMPDAFMLVNSDKIILAANDRARSMFNLEVSNHGMLAACLNKELGERWENCVDRALIGGGAVTVMDEWQGALLRSTFSPVIKPSGKVADVAISISDVSENHALHSSLREQEEFFTSVFNNSVEGMCLLGLDGSFLKVNSQLERLVGFSQKELQEHSLMGVLHPDDQGVAAQWLSNVAHDDVVFIRKEVRFIHKSGESVWAMVSGSVINDGNNKPMMLACHTVNIDDLKRTETALKESESKYLTLFNCATDMIFLISMDDGTIKEWNESVQNVYGYSGDELRKLKITDLDCMYSKAELKKMAHELALGGARVFYSRHLTKEKDELDVQVQVRPILLTGKEYALTLVKDISEERRLKASLQQAQKSNDAAIRARDAFLENMSHELRTPLNGMFGMLQLLEGTSLDETQMQYVNTARKTGAGLLRLLDDVLNFSRLEAMQESANPVPLSIHDLVGSVKDAFLAEAMSTGVEFTISMFPGMEDNVIGDVAKLRQILFILVANAFAFTSKGGVYLNVERVVNEDGQEQLVFVVSDTGAGMNAAQLQYVLSPFNAFARRNRAEHKGLGLGLPIAGKLVQLLGGTISFDSIEGQGTIVTVAIPVKQNNVVTHIKLDAESAETQVFGEYEMNDTGEGNGKLAGVARAKMGNVTSNGKRLLLVEDERLSRIAIQRWLSMRGFSVAEVTNGSEALTALREADFDCVLLDIQMPVLNGIETLRAIRSGEVGKQKRFIPVIVLTAYTSKNEEKECINSGADRFLPKPVEFDILEGAIHELT